MGWEKSPRKEEILLLQRAPTRRSCASRESHKQTVCSVGGEATAARPLKEARDKQQRGQCSRFLLEVELDSR